VRPGVRIGVDVGSVRVGVAVSDPSGLLATPFRTLRREADAGPGGTRPGSPAPRDIAELGELVAEVRAVEVVVGLPRTLAGDEGGAADQARKYARDIAAQISPVPVRLHDERLTTVDAHRNLRESGVAGRRHRSTVDQAAAVLILQAALDAERSTGRVPGELVRPDRRKPRTKDGRR
jgi:putative Holliday junction resolvase